MEARGLPVDTGLATTYDVFCAVTETSAGGNSSSAANFEAVPQVPNETTASLQYRLTDAQNLTLLAVETNVTSMTGAPMFGTLSENLNRTDGIIVGGAANSAAASAPVLVNLWFNKPVVFAASVNLTAAWSTMGSGSAGNLLGDCKKVAIHSSNAEMSSASTFRSFLCWPDVSSDSASDGTSVWASVPAGAFKTVAGANAGETNIARRFLLFTLDTLPPPPITISSPAVSHLGHTNKTTGIVLFLVSPVPIFGLDNNGTVAGDFLTLVNCVSAPPQELQTTTTTGVFPVPGARQARSGYDASPLSTVSGAPWLDAEGECADGCGWAMLPERRNSLAAYAADMANATETLVGGARAFALVIDVDRASFNETARVEVTVEIAAGAYQDSAGLHSVEASTFKFYSDVSPPRLLSVTSEEVSIGGGAVEGSHAGEHSLSGAGPITVTFNFSEPVLWLPTLLQSTVTDSNAGTGIVDILSFGIVAHGCLMTAPVTSPGCRFSPRGAVSWQVLCYPKGEDGSRGSITLQQGAVSDSAGNPLSDPEGYLPARSLNFTVCSLFRPNRVWFNASSFACEECPPCPDNRTQVRANCGGTRRAHNGSDVPAAGKVVWSAGECVACPTGYSALSHSAPSSTSYSLPAAAASSFDSPAAVWIPASEWYRGGQQHRRCVACPAGWFRNLISENASSPGAPAAVFVGACRACPTGWYGNTPAAGNCSACAAGQYQERQGKSICTDCTAGRTTRGSAVDDGTGASECRACAPGKFTDQQASTEECENCPAGYATNTTASVYCSVCPAGKKQSREGNTTCFTCEAGQFVDEEAANECKNCEVGQSTIEGNTKYCANCPQGRAGQKCDICVAGRFQNEGNKACVGCPSGFYQPDERKIDCTRCEAGKYSLVANETLDQTAVNSTTGFEGPAGAAHCSDCPQGYIQPQTTQEKCEMCEAGSYQPDEGRGECTQFAALEQPDQARCVDPNDDDGGRGCWAFTPCNGTQSRFTKQTAERTWNCRACDPGWDRTQGDKCAPCETGRYRGELDTSERDGDNVRACKICPRGYFQQNQQGVSCERCPQGWGADAGAKTCQLEREWSPGEGGPAVPAGRVNGSVVLEEALIVVRDNHPRRVKISWEYPDHPEGTEFQPGATLQGWDVEVEPCLQLAGQELVKRNEDSSNNNPAMQRRLGQSGRDSIDRNMHDGNRLGEWDNPAAKGLSAAGLLPESLFSQKILIEDDDDGGGDKDDEDNEDGARGYEEVIDTAKACIYNFAEKPDLRAVQFTFAEPLVRLSNLVFRVRARAQPAVDADGFKPGIRYGSWSSRSKSWITTADCGESQYLNDTSGVVGTVKSIGNGEDDIIVFSRRKWDRRCGSQSFAEQDAGNGMGAGGDEVPMDLRAAWQVCPEQDPLQWRCRPCPEGGTCFDSYITSRTIGPKFGYWKNGGAHRVPDCSSLTEGCLHDPDAWFLKCVVPEACLGGPIISGPPPQGNYANLATLDYWLKNRPNTTGCNLALGYKDVCDEDEGSVGASCRKCQQCMDGFSRIKLAQCQPCGDPAKGELDAKVGLALIMLGIFAVFSAMIALKVRSAHRPYRKAVHSTMKRILVSHMQTLSLAYGFNVAWPDGLNEFMKQLTVVVTLTDQIGSIECEPGIRDIAKNGGNKHANIFYSGHSGLLIAPWFSVPLLWLYWIHLSPSSKIWTCGGNLAESEITYFRCCCGGCTTGRRRKKNKESGKDQSSDKGEEVNLGSIELPQVEKPDAEIK